MADPVLEIEGLSKRYGATEVLRRIDLTVAKGEVVSIIGASGSGKTSLLRCINLLEEFQDGVIKIAGEEIGYSRTGARRVALSESRRAGQRALTGMAFQHFNLFPHLTALDNVALGLIKVRGMKRAEAREIASGWLDRVGLQARRDYYPGQLSGGQQQRVGIARALAMAPKLMLLDEITSALDPELAAEVLNVVRELATEGMTMLFVTHEMRFAHDVATRSIFMDHGVIVERGPPREIFHKPHTARLAAFLKNSSF